jgi:hypothetical protein
MAWQLIYTSAPRLLEAGRSGFGTVARHRQIPALVVAAVERISQFSRLPGLDAGRVIYAYRQITVGSGRFHVLSCIRDAGADYTGRTNHHAHHLIAEPREVAALGPNGPSPADVLLAFPWLGAWPDPARWLEAADEIPFAHMPPQTSNDGACWARVTGNPAHAWLLAHGEAGRNATLLTPPGCDLRPLFAESLRLTPERLWQVPFTTDFQPSDDAADFRWVALSANDPASTPGQRPALDLSRPQSLPMPEVPALPAAVSVTPSSAIPVATQGSGQGHSPRTAVTVSAASTSTQRADDPFTSYEPRRPIRWPWFLAASVVALAAAGAGVFFLRSHELGEKRERAKASIAQLRAKETLEKELKGVINEAGREQLAKIEGLIVAANHPDNAQALETISSDDAILQKAKTALRKIVDEKRPLLEAKVVQVQQLPEVPTQPAAKDSTPVPPAKPALEPRNSPPAVSAQGTTEVTKAADTASPPVLYFVADNSQLSVELPANQSALKFWLQRKDGQPEELKPYGGNLANGLGPYGKILKVLNQKLVGGEEPPTVPYMLALKEGADEIKRAYVGWGRDDRPIIASIEGGLKRDQQAIVFSSDALPLPGVVKDRLWLRTPLNFSGAGSKQELIEMKDSRSDIAPFVQRLEKQLSPSASPAVAAQNGLAANEAGLVTELRAEIGGQKVAPPAKGAQGATVDTDAVTSASELLATVLETHWDKIAGTTPKPGERIREALKQKEQNWASVLKELKEDFRHATANWIGKSQYKPQKEWVEKIEKLSQRVCELEMRKQNAHTNAEAEKRALVEAEQRAKALREHPLLRGQIPSGTYTLLVESGDTKLPLIEFRIP